MLKYSANSAYKNNNFVIQNIDAKGNDKSKSKSKSKSKRENQKYYSIIRLFAL
jgi:hypothetical protein